MNQNFMKGLVEATIAETKKIVFESFVSKLTSDKALVESIVKGSSLFEEREINGYDVSNIFAGRKKHKISSQEAREMMSDNETARAIIDAAIVDNDETAKEIIAASIMNAVAQQAAKFGGLTSANAADRINSIYAKVLSPEVLDKYSEEFAFSTFIMTAIKNAFKAAVSDETSMSSSLSGAKQVPLWKEGLPVSNKSLNSSQTKGTRLGNTVKHDGVVYKLDLEMFPNGLTADENDTAPGLDTTWKIVSELSAGISTDKTDEDGNELVVVSVDDEGFDLADFSIDEIVTPEVVQETKGKRSPYTIDEIEAFIKEYLTLIQNGEKQMPSNVRERLLPGSTAASIEVIKKRMMTALQRELTKRELVD